MSLDERVTPLLLPTPDAPVKLVHGDATNVTFAIPRDSLHACVTSPPYYGLRRYTEGAEAEREIGREATPAEYVEHLVIVFRAVRDALRPDGVLWLVLGDTYAANRPYQVPDSKHRHVGNSGAMKVPAGLKPKDLIGIPWRVAFALQADGWYLRAECIWHKPNCMPDSAKDRPTRAHETVFMLTKQAKGYYFDMEAVKEPVKASSLARVRQNEGHPKFNGNRQRGFEGNPQTLNPRQFVQADGRRHIRTVWTVAPVPFSTKRLPGYTGQAEHFAAYPPKLIEPMIRATTSERGCCPTCGVPWRRAVERGAITDHPARKGATAPPRMAVTSATQNGQAGAPSAGQGRNGLGESSLGLMRLSHTTGWQPTCQCPPAEPVPCIVFDPFCGTGTTGLVARNLGRLFLGSDLNPEYVDIAHARIALAKPPEESDHVA
jgi:DNA modification methylase